MNFSRTFLKNKLIIAGFRIFFHTEADTGKFADHQLAGGIDDTAGAEMAADSTEVLKGQGNVDMASLGADSAVERYDLAMIGYFPNVYTAGIPHPSAKETANTGKNHTGLDILYPADLTNGFQQILSPAESNTMANHFTSSGNDTMFHITPQNKLT